MTDNRAEIHAEPNAIVHTGKTVGKSSEIRGRVKPEYYQLIQTVADFTGDTPFEFCLSAGLEKARELILEKIEFETTYSKYCQKAGASEP